MKARHAWETEKSTARWRILERCTRCGWRRWLITFENRTGGKRQTHIYSKQFDPWAAIAPDCKATPAPGPDGGEK